MSTLDSRLKKLMPALTARERGILVLKSLKDKTPEDPDWRYRMPSDQVREFNRYIGLMNAANVQLGHLLTFIEGQVAALEAKFNWLLTLWLWEGQLDQALQVFYEHVREPITESAYRKLVKGERAQMIGVSEAGEILLDGEEEP